MDLAKLISLLETKAIWLARADTFKDRHEGRFPDEMRMLAEKACGSFSKDDPSPVQDADDFQDYLLKNTFVNCWHENIDENMVMWEIYGRDTKGSMDALNTGLSWAQTPQREFEPFNSAPGTNSRNIYRRN